mmetsp:Transcript_7386/g.15234  ORF Transcript_7386/g.15234 Transcript_7386/m.15234 type:complete len:369 (-) Transcript_7386:601-1707(-)
MDSATTPRWSSHSPPTINSVRVSKSPSPFERAMQPGDHKSHSTSRRDSILVVAAAAAAFAFAFWCLATDTFEKNRDRWTAPSSPMGLCERTNRFRDEWASRPSFRRTDSPVPSMSFRDRSRDASVFESDRTVSARSRTSSSSEPMSQSVRLRDRRLVHSPRAEKKRFRRALEEGIVIRRNSIDSRQPFRFPASAIPSRIGRRAESSSEKERLTIRSDLRVEMALLSERRAFPRTLAPSRSRRQRSIVSSSIRDSPSSRLSFLWWIALVRSKKSQLRPPPPLHEEDEDEADRASLPASRLLSHESWHGVEAVVTLLSVSDDAPGLVSSEANNFVFSSSRALSSRCRFLSIMFGVAGERMLLVFQKAMCQ